jgi:hypothetical protein
MAWDSAEGARRPSNNFLEGFTVRRYPILAYEKLWNILLNASDPLVAESAMRLFYLLVEKADLASLNLGKIDVRSNFITALLEKLVGLSNSSKIAEKEGEGGSNGNPGRQIERCLELLSYFITQTEAKSNSGKKYPFPRFPFSVSCFLFSASSLFCKCAFVTFLG